MLVLFFTIIFIAELIIAGWIIGGIASIDKNVCALNQEVIDFQPQIKSSLKSLQTAANKVFTVFDCFTDFVTQKKDYCKETFKKNLTTQIILSVLKIYAKRLVTFIEIAFAIKKLLKK